MIDDGLVREFDRAERAIERIERALRSREARGGREEVLRSRVREVVAELDSLIEGIR